VNPDEKGRSYVEGARLELAHYAQSLLRENERLRALAATLETEKRQLEMNAGQAVNELERLKTKYEVVENENYQYLERYHQIEAQSANLSNLYVASYQLHSSVDREFVLNAIQEIVINLIGSEEVAIFAENGQGKFDLASCFGVEPSLLRPFSLGEGPIGQALARGEVYAENFPISAAGRITACVPLKINDTIIGAIVVFRLLSHKAALERVDHELFDLLAIHASTALYCATLHADLTASVEVAS